MEIDTDRFWNKVDKRGEDDCWRWTAALSDGYGMFTIARPLQTQAHRVSAVLAGIIESLDSDKIIRHACDNRACVNPAHLLAGTVQDNVNDRTKRGRAQRKYSPELIAQMRAARATGETQQSIADRFGVPKSAVHWYEHNQRKDELVN